jgi:hypothetical protein
MGFLDILGNIGGFLGDAGKAYSAFNQPQYPEMSQEEKDLLKRQADILGISYDMMLALSEGQKEIGLQTMAEETGMPMGAMGGTFGAGAGYGPAPVAPTAPTVSPEQSLFAKTYGIMPGDIGTLSPWLGGAGGREKLAFALNRPDLFGTAEQMGVGLDIPTQKYIGAGPAAAAQRSEWKRLGVTGGGTRLPSNIQSEYQKYLDYTKDPSAYTTPSAGAQAQYQSDYQKYLADVAAQQAGGGIGGAAGTGTAGEGLIGLRAGLSRQAIDLAGALGQPYEETSAQQAQKTALETYLQQRGALRGRGSGYAGEAFARQYAGFAGDLERERRGEIQNLLGLTFG